VQASLARLFGALTDIEYRMDAAGAPFSAGMAGERKVGPYSEPRFVVVLKVLRPPQLPLSLLGFIVKKPRGVAVHA
jgi:hypothetical protein